LVFAVCQPARRDIAARTLSRLICGAARASAAPCGAARASAGSDSWCSEPVVSTYNLDYIQITYRLHTAIYIEYIWITYIHIVYCTTCHLHIWYIKFIYSWHITDIDHVLITYRLHTISHTIYIQNTYKIHAVHMLHIQSPAGIIYLE
jgi:hypothetical protein